MEEVFQCDECSYAKRTDGSKSNGRTKTSLKSLLFFHSLSVHGVGRSLAFIRQLILRKTGHLTRESVACDECSATFLSLRYQQALKTHLAMRHSELKLPFSSVSKGQPKAACDDCPRVFLDKRSLVAHQSLEHGLSAKRRKQAPHKKISCDDCPKRFSKGRVKAHWLFAHSPIRSASRLRALLPRAPPNEVFCEDCGQRFVRDGLWKHWAAKHGGRRELLGGKRRTKVACDDCGRRLLLRNNFLRHWLSHHRS